MKTALEIVRRKNAGEPPYTQIIEYSDSDENATVATALTNINNSGEYKDINGAAVSHIYWECSCLQKKCGACAMVINSVPRLACDAKLSELGSRVRIEPLRKFPVIADLMADRTQMLENLKKMRLWLNEQSKTDELSNDIAYEASRCLQCGCCLEVCPNFFCGSDFFGAAAMTPVSRIIAAAPESQKKELFKEYREHFFEGCGKSLACRNICPAGIDIDGLLVNSNSAAIWKRKRRKK